MNLQTARTEFKYPGRGCVNVYLQEAAVLVIVAAVMFLATL